LREESSQKAAKDAKKMSKRFLLLRQGFARQVERSVDDERDVRRPGMSRERGGRVYPAVAVDLS
jgi:hypothetical protein